ncbi:Hypothetical protein SRAE_2000086300 [Strongyloides ratti]|uniref:SAP30-binding protein n=1 Tax=Strongyloides ratti TaxID=34506 RepID=A0A090LDL5_STRRB|nr:Hypothetical protein SRAE_2000086300 [Strongyloides ratti]CEF66193.1 Hypothetical protein SRAE_2000086300 [Strongyloides ratti]
MSNCDKSSVEKIKNQDEMSGVLDETLKKEELVFKDNTNIGRVDKFAKVKSALRKSLALNIEPGTFDDKGDELKSKILGYMKNHSDESEVSNQSISNNYVRRMSKKFEKDNLKDFQTSCKKVNEYETKSETNIVKSPPFLRQYNSDTEISDKIPDVGGLRNYYKYMGYSDINNTVKMVSELKASINDKSKPFD